MISMSRLSSWLLVGAIIWGVIGFVVYCLLVAAKRADERADAIFNAMRSHPSTSPHLVVLEDDGEVVVIEAQMPPAPPPLPYDHEKNGDFDAF